MSCPVVRPVTISFSDLQDKKASLSTMIEKGLGPEGLGIISISDVPGYSTLRQKLLLLSPRLANLPEEEKKKIEDPHSRYNFGWSHGKEKLGSGKLDTLKGSFYANPMLDVPTTDESLIQRYPSYCGRNIWPESSLPELEDAFKSLGQMIFNVGLLVAYHCDQYGECTEEQKAALNNYLKALGATREGCFTISLHNKGCKLAEFELNSRTQLYDNSVERAASATDNDLIMSSWCGWHTDHGCLTGLTCSMYSRDGVEIACLDSDAGLYIRTRSDHVVKVVYGEDEIAYQIGETTEILSGGYLCATPHCVRAPKAKEASSLERSTFALFMQPDWDEVLKFPENVHIHRELIKSNGCLTFGEYTEKLLDKYYYTKP